MDTSVLTVKQVGFSLVELLVTLIISVTVISGLFTIYLNTRMSQQFTQASAEIQENGRFALEYLSRNIRMIGYNGCSSKNPPTISINAKNLSQHYDPFKHELIGFDIKDNWHVGTLFENVSALHNRPKVGTSALLISRMVNIGAPLIQPLNHKTDPLIIETQLATQLNLKQDDIMYISDCNHGDIFSLSHLPIINGESTSLLHSIDTNTLSALSNLYQENAYVTKYQSHFYFVGDTQRINKAGDKIFALYQVNIDYSSSPTSYVTNELIEGVENLQLLYGEVLSNKNIRYAESYDVQDMTKVISIQLGLLISSSNHVRKSNDTNNYYLAQKFINSADNPDKRLRHAFNTTINIRHRNQEF